MGNVLNCFAKQRHVEPPLHTEIVNIGGNMQSGNLQQLPPSYEEAIATPGVQVVNVAQESVQPRLLVAAIDFGTTFSGYAFSFRHEYNVDPLKISINTWQHSNGMSNKAPSAVLFDADRKVNSFGFDAERDYADIGHTKDVNNWYYFHRFKMRLYQEQHLTVNTMLEDINGKRLPAIDVFSGVIEYIRNHLLTRLRNMDTMGHVAVTSIHWVITVPAIWDDKAKQFMRKAAQKAGIENRNITLSLEPEAASLFCRSLPTFNCAGNGTGQHYQPFAKGTKYMILDLGGGTVDVTVHGIQTDGTLEELHQATGGYWGGTKVDEKFYNILNILFGSDVIAEVGNRFPHEMLELQSEFEIKKRTFVLNQTKPVIIRIPIGFIECLETNGKTLGGKIQQSMYNGKIEFKKDKMFFQADLFSEFFSESVSCIVNHIRELLAKPTLSDISTILLVGGYSECHVVKDTVVSTFPQIRVVHPEDSGLAVLKGAILFGHEPKAISSRVCKYTYGIAMTLPFREGVHPENKRRRIANMDVCDDIYDIHLRIGQKIKLDENQPEKEYRIIPGQTKGILELYASSKPNVSYVTEEGCTFLGSVVIENSEGFQSGKIFAKLLYGGTELGVEARDGVTGKTTKAYFDFLG